MIFVSPDYKDHVGLRSQFGSVLIALLWLVFREAGFEAYPGTLSMNTLVIGCWRGRNLGSMHPTAHFSVGATRAE